MASFTSQPDVPPAAGPLIYPLAVQFPLPWGYVARAADDRTVDVENPPSPASDSLDRWARINYLGEVPDGSGCLFAPDLNGKLYLIEGGKSAALS